MTYHFFRRAAAAALVAVVTGAVAGLAGGCGGGGAASPARSTGRPKMLQMFWRGAGREPIDLLAAGTDSGAGTPPVVAPMPVRVEAIFDRKLDGSMIEDGSTDPPRPRPDPPVMVEFPGKDDAFRLIVTYASNGPSILISGRPGYPSDELVTLVFDRMRVTSQSGDPLDGIAAVTVQTEPFSGTARSSTASGRDLAPPSAIVLSFNNHPHSANLPAQVEVRTVDGRPLNVSVYPDSLDDTRWYVVPGACLGEWPAGEVLLTVRADAVDLYGRPMAAPIEARFVVGGQGGAEGAGGAGGVSGAGGGAPAADDAGVGCDGGA